MKNKLRYFFFFFFSKLIPQIHYLKWLTDGALHNVVIDDETKLYAPYNISASSIGKGTYIAKNANIVLTNIGKYCSIGPNLSCGWGVHPKNGLSTSPIFYSTSKQVGYTMSKENKVVENKGITIGNDVFIGMNVTILDGVNIGDGAIIGAGAVVSKDIPPYAIAVGSPIQIKSYRFEQHIIDSLLTIKWWDFEDTKLRDVEKYFFDIEKFIEKYNDR